MVLKDYILRGYAVNRQRMEVLGQVVRVLRRAEGELDAGQVLSVVERYARALDLLDAYDHQGIRKPEGCPGGVVLVYEECRAFVDALGFREFSSLFGQEKDAQEDDSSGVYVDVYAAAILVAGRRREALRLLEGLPRCTVEGIDKNDLHSFLFVDPLWEAIRGEPEWRAFTEWFAR